MSKKPTNACINCIYGGQCFITTPPLIECERDHTYHPLTYNCHEFIKENKTKDITVYERNRSIRL